MITLTAKSSSAKPLANIDLHRFNTTFNENLFLFYLTAMSRKDSSRSTRSTRNRSSKSGKSRSVKKTSSQATIRVDTEPYMEGRPMSVNMELIRNEAPLPPSYDESNEIEEKISDTRENAGMFSEEANKPNLSENPGPVHFNISPTESLPEVFPMCTPTTKTHADKAPTPVDKAPTLIGKTPTPADKTPTHVGKAPTHVGKAPTHVGKAPTHVGKAPTPVGKAQTSTGKAPTPTGKAPTADMEDLDFDDLSDLEEQELEPIKQVPKQQPESETMHDLKRESTSVIPMKTSSMSHGDPEKVQFIIKDPICVDNACLVSKDGGGDNSNADKKLGRTSSSITLGEHLEKRLPPRQHSCLELRQLDENRSISFNMEGITEEDEPSPKEDDVFLPKTHTINDLSTEVTGSATDLNKDKKKDRGKDKSKKKLKNKSKKDVESATKARSSKHRKNPEIRIVERRKGTPKKRRTKRPVMSPPTLRSLHTKQLKILDSATAVRLANYDKHFGSSREDLTTLIPALKHEKVRLLCEYDRGVIRDRVHNPRTQRRRRTATTDSGSTRSRSSRGDRRRRKRGKDSGSITPLGSERTSAIDSDTESTDTDDPGADPLQQAEIPIGPVLAFFFGYISLGAIMFFFIQDNWNLFESFYFCFITLTTIGFGDYVPADKLHSLLACCVYTLVGMAVTSMCIALIMKKFVVTVKHIGRRVGIVGDDD